MDNIKVCLIFLVMAIAVVSVNSSFDESQWSSAANDVLAMQAGACHGQVGDCLAEDQEIMVGRGYRQLMERNRYISYEALRKNNIPCPKTGHSYYTNCRGNIRANPYNRGCTVITKCARFMG